MQLSATPTGHLSSKPDRTTPAEPAPGGPMTLSAEADAPAPPRILIVDDDPEVRSLCRDLLEDDGLQCDEAADGIQGVAAARSRPYDLVLLDVDMPGMNGFEVLSRLRENPPDPHLKIIMFSGRATGDELAHMLLNGSDDYLTKPFSIVQLRGRVRAALRRKEAQDRAERAQRRLALSNHQLEQSLLARDSALAHAQRALVLGLAELVAYRDIETGTHLTRVQRYSCCLAAEAARLPAYAGVVNDHFITMLECCAPLHDIGKVGLPDHILLKPGRLDPSERLIMQTHTLIGAETLRKVAGRHGAAIDFLQMAIDVARGHHERWDGKGYPDKLAGEAIPLAARIVALADVYDALRAHRAYKPALPHAAVVQMMTELSDGQFDPRLLELFKGCAHQFDRIYQELPG
ncbi:MAG TPA: response regulator [Gemmataceae bacterium]|nr:response regulator [Gemmataceae bacterium]